MATPNVFRRALMRVPGWLQPVVGVLMLPLAVATVCLLPLLLLWLVGQWFYEWVRDGFPAPEGKGRSF